MYNNQDISSDFKFVEHMDKPIVTLPVTVLNAVVLKYLTWVLMYYWIY